MPKTQLKSPKQSANIKRSEEEVQDRDEQQAAVHDGNDADAPQHQRRGGGGRTEGAEEVRAAHDGQDQVGRGQEGKQAGRLVIEN